MTVTDARPVVQLTTMQAAVFRLLVLNGADNATIARELHLAESTVKTHMNRVLAATGHTTRTELAVAYLRGRFGIAVRDLRHPS
jgi:DNA-binding NarL/FixJ family response regulator